MSRINCGRSGLLWAPRIAGLGGQPPYPGCFCGASAGAAPLRHLTQQSSMPAMHSLQARRIPIPRPQPWLAADLCRRRRQRSAAALAVPYSAALHAEAPPAAAGQPTAPAACHSSCSSASQPAAATTEKAPAADAAAAETAATAETVPSHVRYHAAKTLGTTLPALPCSMLLEAPRLKSPI